MYSSKKFKFLETEAKCGNDEDDDEDEEDYEPEDDFFIDDEPESVELEDSHESVDLENESAGQTAVNKVGTLVQSSAFYWSHHIEKSRKTKKKFI